MKTMPISTKNKLKTNKYISLRWLLLYSSPIWLEIVMFLFTATQSLYLVNTAYALHDVANYITSTAGYWLCAGFALTASGMALGLVLDNARTSRLYVTTLAFNAILWCLSAYFIFTSTPLANPVLWVNPVEMFFNYLTIAILALFVSFRGVLRVNYRGCDG